MDCFFEWELATSHSRGQASGWSVCVSCLLGALERWRRYAGVCTLNAMPGLLPENVRRHNMSARVKRCSHLAIVLVVFISFVFTGCKIDGTIDFQSDGRTKIVLIFEDADGMMAKIKQTCEGVRLTFEAELTFVKNPKVEDVTPPGGHLKCRLTSNEPFGGHVKFIKNDEKYYFRYPGAHDKDNDDYSDFVTNITISMPAKIVKANRGKVNGNKVTITSLDFLTYGVEITAEKESSGSASSGVSGKKADGASSSVSGFPAWTWAAVGGGVLAVIAGLAFVAGRRRGEVKVLSGGGLSRPGGPSVGRAAASGGGGEVPVSSPPGVPGL